MSWQCLNCNVWQALYSQLVIGHHRLVWETCYYTDNTKSIRGQKESLINRLIIYNKSDQSDVSKYI